MIKDQISQLFNVHVENKFKQKKTDANYRIKKLQLIKDEIILKKTEIEEALQYDFGKACLETSLTEILPVISMINLYSKKLKKWMKAK